MNGSSYLWGGAWHTAAGRQPPPPPPPPHAVAKSAGSRHITNGSSSNNKTNHNTWFYHGNANNLNDGSHWQSHYNDGLYQQQPHPQTWQQFPQARMHHSLTPAHSPNANPPVPPPPASTMPAHQVHDTKYLSSGRRRDTHPVAPAVSAYHPLPTKEVIQNMPLQFLQRHLQRKPPPPPPPPPPQKQQYSRSSLPHTMEHSRSLPLHVLQKQTHEPRWQQQHERDYQVPPLPRPHPDAKILPLQQLQKQPHYRRIPSPPPPRRFSPVHGNFFVSSPSSSPQPSPASPSTPPVASSTLIATTQPEEGSCRVISASPTPPTTVQTSFDHRPLVTTPKRKRQVIVIDEPPILQPPKKDGTYTDSSVQVDRNSVTWNTEVVPGSTMGDNEQEDKEAENVACGLPPGLPPGLLRNEPITQMADEDIPLSKRIKAEDISTLQEYAGDVEEIKNDDGWFGKKAMNQKVVIVKIEDIEDEILPIEEFHVETFTSIVDGAMPVRLEDQEVEQGFEDNTSVDNEQTLVDSNKEGGTSPMKPSPTLQELRASSVDGAVPVHLEDQEVQQRFEENAPVGKEQTADETDGGGGTSPMKISPAIKPQKSLQELRAKLERAKMKKNQMEERLRAEKAASMTSTEESESLVSSTGTTADAPKKVKRNASSTAPPGNSKAKAARDKLEAARSKLRGALKNRVRALQKTARTEVRSSKSTAKLKLLPVSALTSSLIIRNISSTGPEEFVRFPHVSLGEDSGKALEEFLGKEVIQNLHSAHEIVVDESPQEENVSSLTARRRELQLELIALKDKIERSQGESGLLNDDDGDKSGGEGEEDMKEARTGLKKSKLSTGSGLTKEELEKRKAEAQTTMDISYWKHFVSKQEHILEQVSRQIMENEQAIKDNQLELHETNINLHQTQKEIDQIEIRKGVVEDGIAKSMKELLDARQSLYEVRKSQNEESKEKAS